MIILWGILTLISTIIFYFLYKRTHMSGFLIFGLVTNIELFFRTAGLIPKEYFIPIELLCILGTLLWLYSNKEYKIIILIIFELALYLFIQYYSSCVMQGLAGFCFGLILLLWYYKNKDEVCVDPFECG